MENIARNDADLMRYMFSRIEDVKGLSVVGPEDPDKRCAVLSFNIDGLGSHDVAIPFKDGELVSDGCRADTEAVILHEGLRCHGHGILHVFFDNRLQNALSTL